MSYGGGLEVNCRTCPPGRRVWRGCEVPSERPILRITCPHCLGAGCEECRQGRFEVFRCPGRTVPRIAWELCRDLGLLESGILPGEGGWLDQPQTWVDALDLLASERAAYREEERRRRE